MRRAETLMPPTDDPPSDDELTAFAATGVLAARVVAELRRLRSDAWLESAAAEIGGWVIAPVPSTVVAILRKHRDGKTS